MFADHGRGLDRPTRLLLAAPLIVAVAFLWGVLAAVDTGNPGWTSWVGWGGMWGGFWLGGIAMITVLNLLFPVMVVALAWSLRPSGSPSPVPQLGWPKVILPA